MPHWLRLNPPQELKDILEACPSVTIPRSIAELVDHSVGGRTSNKFVVDYDLPGGARFTEAWAVRVRNGVAANYTDPYMRRRDSDCMVIADDKPTDKKRYRDRFGKDFAPLRAETMEWLKTQPLAVFPFIAGHRKHGLHALAVVPENAGFFALGLALLQGMLGPDEVPEDFDPKAIIYAAPPFRHTHFGGKQVVVHNRLDNMHEMFAYNLYPGPSAKKGVYGLLIALGEKEGWVTAHCSTVKVVTPYDTELVIMHEGASGGGKSEMLQHPHRMSDGRLLLGENTVTQERRYLEIPRTCDLCPVTDDMALCHPSLQDDDGLLGLTDAEASWFVRVDHIREYGTDPFLEKLTAQPKEPLLFLNIDAVPDGRALIWEHIEDEPGKPCPNPRVVIPRAAVPNIVNEPVKVNVRSIGVRTPPCTKEQPTYGIIGLLHLLPPSLAWLWRLVAPRGHANPSIVSTSGNAMSSEGVGSYWPFATGRRVDQANLLLEQIERTRRTQFILTPNQHIGAWKTGFMPQWIAREYLARRGNARFREDQLRASRCPLLGYSLYSMTVEGRHIPRWFTQVETQPEVGTEAYDQGAEILHQFFVKCLGQFEHEDLLPLGRSIIQCCLDRGTLADYEAVLPVD